MPDEKPKAASMEVCICGHPFGVHLKTISGYGTRWPCRSEGCNCSEFQVQEYVLVDESKAITPLPCDHDQSERRQIDEVLYCPRCLFRELDRLRAELEGATRHRENAIVWTKMIADDRDAATRRADLAEMQREADAQKLKDALGDAQVRIGRIDAVWEKHKHRDVLLRDDEWLRHEKWTHEMLHELWRAIRPEQEDGGICHSRTESQE